MDCTSNLPVKVPVTIGTMLNFDGDGNRDRHGDFICKQTFRSVVVKYFAHRSTVLPTIIFRHFFVMMKINVCDDIFDRPFRREISFLEHFSQ